MAGTLINTYSQLDSDILAVQLTLDKTRKSLHAVSLTNYDNTSEPQIAAGSVIEVNGGFYEFEANETITGSPSDGTVYIMIVPGTTTCTAQYTNTAPTWSDSKQGFYGTGGSANYRYLEFRLVKNSSSWTPKKILSRDVNDIAGFMDDGTPFYCKSLSFSVTGSTTSANIAHGITNALTNQRILNIQHIVTLISGVTYEWVGYIRSYYRVDDTNIVIYFDTSSTFSGRITVFYK